MRNVTEIGRGKPRQFTRMASRCVAAAILAGGVAMVGCTHNQDDADTHSTAGSYTPSGTAADVRGGSGTGSGGTGSGLDAGRSGTGGADAVRNGTAGVNADGTVNTPPIRNGGSGTGTGGIGVGRTTPDTPVPAAPATLPSVEPATPAPVPATPATAPSTEPAAAAPAAPARAPATTPSTEPAAGQ